MAACQASGGFQVIFGMTWGAIQDPKKESREATAFAKSNYAEYKVRVQSNNEISYGALSNASELIAKHKKGTVLSAAVLFASLVEATEHNLLVITLESGKTAVIAVVNGVPYLDVVVPSENASDRIHSLLRELGGAMQGFGDCTSQFPDASPMSVDELLTGDKKAAALHKFSDLKGIRTILILVALALAANFGWDYWKEVTKRREIEEARKKKIDPVKVYRESVQKLLAAGGVTGATATTAIWGAAKTVEIDQEGWQLESITCGPANCRETWKRKWGTNAGFVHAARTGSKATFSNEATLSNSYSTPAKPTPLTRETLPQRDAFELAFSTQAQSEKAVGISYLYAVPTVLGLTPGVTAAAVPKELIVYKGTFNGAGPLGLVDEVLAGLPANCTLDEFVISLSGGDPRAAKFNLKGSYYVKN